MLEQIKFITIILDSLLKLNILSDQSNRITNTYLIYIANIINY